MPTIERARVIQQHMGTEYGIYWDEVHGCFRVMSRLSSSLNRGEYIHVS